MINMRWTMAIVAVLGVGVGLGSALGCHDKPVPRAPVAQAAPREAGPAQVVSHQEAVRLGGATPLVIPFGLGRDGTKLVVEVMKRADAARAAGIADLAIILQSRRDDQLVECRAEVVQESVTAPQWQPPKHRVVPLDPPVTRTVTEWVYQCGPVTRAEMRSRTDHEQQCGLVTRAVPRSTTVYSASTANAVSAVTNTVPSRASTSASFVPFTDFYTEYSSVYECESVPVVRVGPELVIDTRCAPELHTRTVTRHEFQFAQQYIPAHFEAFPRQRLRELEPVCYTVDAHPGTAVAPRNRIEGVVLMRAP
jgi:hypothetical protein